MYQQPGRGNTEKKVKEKNKHLGGHSILEGGLGGETLRRQDGSERFLNPFSATESPGLSNSFPCSLCRPPMDRVGRTTTI